MAQTQYNTQQFPARTRVQDIEVRSRWTPSGWLHAMPSKSTPGTIRYVINGSCNCPARRTCWHRTTAKAVEAQLHMNIWDSLRQMSPWSSGDAYGSAIRYLERLGLDEATARKVAA
jgi:hypothetical protein